MARGADVDRRRDGPVVPRGPVALLVDDEPEWINWISRRLRECEWVIVPVLSGAAALAAYDRTAPDVVIADQKMPGMPGTELARALRDRGFGGPMMLLSASIDSETNSECFRLGIHALSKLSHGAIFHTLELFKQDVLAQRSIDVALVDEVSAPSAPLDEECVPSAPADEVSAPSARRGRWRQLLSVSASHSPRGS